MLHTEISINKNDFMKKLFLLTTLLAGLHSVKSQMNVSATITQMSALPGLNIAAQQLHKTNSGRMNFFVFTREKSKKLDLLSFYTLLRARVKSFFHKKQFRVIKANSSGDAAARITTILLRQKKLIKNIWFDSHGHYINRYSSFRIGTDQFSYKNINNNLATEHLREIALFCDELTKVGIGSCYAGADFYFPATDSTSASRMNGDSLMVGMGNIFPTSGIYASESWVMAKPGIFTNHFGFAGFPLDKRFKNRIYAPVWERIGMWRKYSAQAGAISSVPTIALDNKGNININRISYNNLKKAKNKIAKVSRLFKADFPASRQITSLRNEI
jgi:hypothetical protein